MVGWVGRCYEMITETGRIIIRPCQFDLVLTVAAPLHDR